MGKSMVTMHVPLTLAPNVAADGAIHLVNLEFRGPHGKTFGEVITLKVRCAQSEPAPPTNFVNNEVSQIDIYKLAIKLHEQLQLGSLEACIVAVRENNCNEAETIKAMQRNQ